MSDAPLNPKKRPLGVVLTIIRHGDETLFIKRTQSPYKGLWALLGGKIEFSENVEDAAVREAFEETGLRCSFVRVCGIGSEVIFENGEPLTHFLLFACELKAPSRDVTAGEEGVLRWFSRAELEKAGEGFVPNDVPMLREFVLENKGAIRVHKMRMRKDGDRYELKSFHA